MAKYVYPAIFTPEEDGGYSIVFPDLDGCYTCGESLSDGIEMAKDVLALVLYGYETENKAIPTPSNLSAFHTENGSFVNYVACDTLVYRKMHNNKAIKKTLTIPEWLNEEATALGINFSQVLQNALMEITGYSHPRIGK